MKMCRFHAMHPALAQAPKGVYFVKGSDGIVPYVKKMTDDLQLPLFGEVVLKSSSSQQRFTVIKSHFDTAFCITPSDIVPWACFGWCVPIVDDPDEATLQATVQEQKIVTNPNGGKVLMEMVTFVAIPDHVGKKNIALTRPRFDCDVDPSKKWNKYASAFSKKILDKKLMPSTPAAPAVDDSESKEAKPASDSVPAAIRHLLI